MGHRTIENELRPIGASIDIDHGLLLAALSSLIAVEPGGHVQKVLNRDGLLSVVDIGDAAIGEKIQQGMIETVEQAVFVNHPEKRAGDRFCRREYLVQDIPGVGRVISLRNNPPMPHDEEAVKAVACAIADKLGEVSRIH